MSTDKSKKASITQLNDCDRKVLNKYTKYYSNFIESNTAKTDVLNDVRIKGRDSH